MVKNVTETGGEAAQSVSEPSGQQLSRTDAIFISWVRFHRRSQGIADALGIPSYYVHSATGGALRRYARQARDTARLIRKHRPKTILLMQPPVFALLAVRVLTFGTKTRIIGDLHSGVFLDPKWRWATRVSLFLLRGRHAAIVTNEPLARIAKEHSVRVLVLHDLVHDMSEDEEGRATALAGVDLTVPLVLVPLAYANDEPVDEILAAARKLDDAVWILTGKAPESLRNVAPPNVRFSGYVTNAEYDWLLRNSAVAVALTTREYTMQCVGYEAMSAGKPLVTSETESLRSFFGSSAVYTESSAEAIRRAVSEALARRAELETLMTAQRTRQIGEQTKALELLVAWTSAA